MRTDVDMRTAVDMRIAVAIQLALMGILLHLPGSDLCKFGANCDYPCHCQNNGVCDPLDGSCPSGCDDGDLAEPGDYWYTGAWSGYGCQLGNVAYGKNATQGVATYRNYTAGLAIDGNHDPFFLHDHCSHTTDNTIPHEPAWWQVDLGANFVVHGVEITNREDCCFYRSEYINITVSNTEGGDVGRALCHSIGSEGIVSIPMSIDCSQPLRGRYVRFQRWAGTQIRFMHICEVQVHGYLFHDCRDAYYGVGCGTPCNCQLPCHDISGECPSKQCTEGWIGYDCQTALPMLNSSTLEISDLTSSSVEVRFNAWVPGNQGEHVPSGYIVQQQSSSKEAWLNGLDIDHDPDTVQVIVVLSGLEPESEYYVRVIPYFVDGEVTFLGHPTAEIGPFWTLRKEFPVGTVAGVTIGLIVVAALAVVIVCMVRRYSARGKDGSQIPVELDSTKPSVYEDVEPSGQDNIIYEDIAEYPNGNGGGLYYNTPSPTIDENIQSAGGIEDINENADIILHDSSSTSFTSGDQESRYQALRTPFQEYEVPALAGELNKSHGDFKEEQLEQYTYLIKFLEALQAEETAIPSSDLEIRYPELKHPMKNSGLSTIQGQYMLLQSSKPSRKPSSKDVPLNQENRPENRDISSLPTSKHSAHLTPIDERNDYINTVAVDGYCNRTAYIATQLPMPNSVADFWRLVYHDKCSCIIALQQPDPGDDSTPVYWPTTTENPIVFGHLRVTLVHEESPDEGALNMMDFEITISSKEKHNVRFYQFLAWPADAKTSLSTEKTLMLLDHAQRWQLSSGLGPLWFICKFGYERCGLMVAACYMLEKLNVDREVDVFQAVQQVRSARPEFVTSLAQYEFLYELAIGYINSCEDYANFK